MKTIRFEGLITLEHSAEDLDLQHIITDEVTSNLESVWPDATVNVSSTIFEPFTHGLPTPSSEPSDRG